MKKMKKFLAISATVVMLALPALAKALPATDASLQDQCTQENKDTWYATFRENYKGEAQPKAYDAAKKYLGCVPEETDITKYLKRWVTAYEKEIRKVKVVQLLYTDKKYPEAYALGREILTDEPDNVKLLVDLGANGYLVARLKNPSLNADALGYAKKALELLGSGKTVDNWQPFTGPDQAQAYLNYTIGTLTLESDPTAALPSLIKAAQSNSELKKSPQPYGYIAGAYEAGPYAKLSDDYKAKFQGKDESPESKLALANINQIVEVMIDAYARAVAAAGNDPVYATQKSAWSESLSTWYKYLHKSDAGMNEMVASILSKPLPPQPTPLTSLPASTPAATPAATSGTPATATAATTVAKPSATTTGNAAKPAPAKTATPAGPGKPRN